MSRALGATAGVAKNVGGRSGGRSGVGLRLRDGWERNAALDRWSRSLEPVPRLSEQRDVSARRLQGWQVKSREEGVLEGAPCPGAQVEVVGLPSLLALADVVVQVGAVRRAEQVAPERVRLLVSLQAPIERGKS